MTELVSRAGLGRSLCAGLVCVALGFALPVTGLAAPAQSPTAEGPAATQTEVAEVPEVAEVRSALEAGDLTTARELAVARSEAEPSADNYALEAEVWLALGDYERAELALDNAIAALPEGADEDRAALKSLRKQVRSSSRGKQPDEPKSSYRKQLDSERADRLAALAPKPEPKPEPVDEPKPSEPVIKKWYFWVTLGAIVATAGAIVGVAVSSSIDERNSDAASRQPAPAGGVMIRF